LLDGRQTSAAPYSVVSATRLRISRSLHAFWRESVRTPWKNFRRRWRSARAAKSGLGVRVEVDETTELALVPFAGRMPPPMSQCTVVEARQYPVRLHPLSQNSTHDERRHYADHSVSAPAMTLEHLVDQYWHPALGLLISREGRIWRHSFLGPFQEGYLTSVKAIVDRPLPDGGTGHFFHEERLGRVETISGEHLLMANSERPNYGHYLLDIVPLAYVGAKIDAPMLSWPLKDWQRTLLKRLEVPERRIREIRAKPVFLDHPIVSNRLSGASSLHAHPHHREAFAQILSNVRKHAGAARTTPKRVLLCRSLGYSRNIANRAAMIEALAHLGFAAIQPEKLTFDEQALTFADAEIIVIEFGAAMANAMFCPPGTTVVEIIAEGQDDPFSAHLAAMLELNHVVLFQRQSDAEKRRSQSRRLKDARFVFSVDVARLVQTVKALIAR
jgi:hypothetical protein